MSLPPLVTPAAELTVDEVKRYSRHLIIPEIGMTGQKRLKNARVLVVGAGGLGSPTALYLAAAGVGTLGIVDFDVVDESNLQRQIIHGQSDVGRPKAQSARDSIREINPYVTVMLHEERLDGAWPPLEDLAHGMKAGDDHSAASSATSTTTVAATPSPRPKSVSPLWCCTLGSLMSPEESAHSLVFDQESVM